MRQRGSLAIGAAGTAREAERLLEVGPRGDESSLFFVAQGEIEERSARRVQALTLRELGQALPYAPRPSVASLARIGPVRA